MQARSLCVSVSPCPQPREENGKGMATRRLASTFLQQQRKGENVMIMFSFSVNWAKQYRHVSLFC